MPHPGSRMRAPGDRFSRESIARDDRPAGAEPPVGVLDLRHQRIESGVHASAAIFVLLEAVRLAQKIERPVLDLG